MRERDDDDEMIRIALHSAPQYKTERDSVTVSFSGLLLRHS